MKKLVFITAIVLTAFAMPAQAHDPCACAAPLTADMLCNEEPGGQGIACAHVEGGVGPYTYSWGPVHGASIVSGQGSYEILVEGSGWYTAYVTITDACGTTVTASCSAYIGGLPGGRSADDGEKSEAPEPTEPQEEE